MKFTEEEIKQLLKLAENYQAALTLFGPFGPSEITQKEKGLVDSAIQKLKGAL